MLPDQGNREGKNNLVIFLSVWHWVPWFHGHPWPLLRCLSWLGPCLERRNISYVQGQRNYGHEYVLFLVTIVSSSFKILSEFWCCWIRNESLRYRGWEQWLPISIRGKNKQKTAVQGSLQLSLQWDIWKIRTGEHPPEVYIRKAKEILGGVLLPLYHQRNWSPNI